MKHRMRSVLLPRLIYFHRIDFPSASGQTIQVIRDYYAMSGRYDVHLMYRSPAAITAFELNSLLGGYHASMNTSFHMHFVQEGVGGARRYRRFVKQLVEEGKGDGKVVLVVRTMDHAETALSMRFASPAVNAPRVLLELHETAVPHMVYRQDGRPLRALLSRWQERKVFSKVDGIVCTVASQLRVLDELFPDHAPAVVLPNSVPENPNSVTGDRGLPIECTSEDRFRMRYAGQFTAWKNTDIMFAALSLLPGNFVLELAGGKMGAEHDTGELIAKKAMQFGVAGRVQYFGFLPPVDVGSFLRQADCLLLPLGDTVQSRLFTSPMKLFEYAASGRPMIVTRQPTTLSLVDENVHALMIRPGDAQDLARAAEKLAESPSVGEKIAGNASQWVRQYSASNRAIAYHEFLGEILKRR